MLKIGKINYLNLYPIFFTLERECDRSRFQFIEGTPAALNQQLRDGTVDISPSSSIEYLRNHENYTLIDGHSISSYGPIMSIVLFSRYPIEKLDAELVLASDQSETSTALLKIIFKKFYGFRTKVITSGKELQDGLESASAYLLIGDSALRGARSSFIKESPENIYTYDLGDIWYKNTGLPFVFALWIGRKECCNEDTFVEFIDILDRAKDFAEKNFHHIASELPDKNIMAPDDVVRYWAIISFGLNDEHRKGLTLFDRYLKEEGLL